MVDEASSLSAIIFRSHCRETSNNYSMPKKQKVEVVRHIFRNSLNTRVDL